MAGVFLAWLAVPKSRVWLDLGCGTGALSEAILEQAAPEQLIGVEPSEQFLVFARERLKDERASFVLGSGAAIPVAANRIDVLVAGFVLNFIPDLDEAFAEMKRVLKPGGVLAAYVWDYADKTEFMRLFWDAATLLDKRAAAFDEGKRFSVCRPESLSAAFAEAGFVQVETRAIDIPTRFKDFDDYWQPFLGGVGSAPGYVASLGVEQRQALRDSLYKGLPVAFDGSIALMARSWAVRGILDKGL